MALAAKKALNRNTASLKKRKHHKFDNFPGERVNDETIDKIFGNILHMRMEWPDIGYDEDCLSPEAADLMKKLMNPNPKERIKIKDVKRHPFFKGKKRDFL